MSHSLDLLLADLDSLIAESAVKPPAKTTTVKETESDREHARSQLLQLQYTMQHRANDILA